MSPQLHICTSRPCVTRAFITHLNHCGSQVLPGDVGHRLPPWFFLMPSYWRDPKLDYVDEKLLAHLLAAGEQKVCSKPCRRS